MSLRALARFCYRRRRLVVGIWVATIIGVNVRAVGDKAAAVALGEKFGPRVEDVLVDNGHRAHAPEPYLNAAVTGAAIADALR